MSKYHGITEETKVGKNGKTVHRLIALETFENGSFTVEKGTLGGWVQNVENIKGNAWVYDDAELLDNAKMTNYTSLRDESSMWDYSYIHDNARLIGKSSLHNFTSMWNDTSLWDNSVMRNTASIAGSVTLRANAELVEYTYLNGNYDLGMGAYVTEELQVLSLNTYTSLDLGVTLYPTRDGEYQVKMGCWLGTVDELEELFKRDEWVETTGQDAEDAREEMLYMIGMMRARIKRNEARK